MPQNYASIICHPLIISSSLTSPGGCGGAWWICPLRVMFMNRLISQVISLAWWVCAR